MKILEKELLKKHTSFRIGGEALYYIIPETCEDVKKAIEFAKEKELPYIVIGNGSNILFMDEGYPGVVIDMMTGLNEIKCEGERIVADAGALLSKTGAIALQNSLTGFEALCGIPGTVGGGITMNAGAYDSQIEDVLESADVLTKSGETVNIKACDLDLGYRHSIIPEKEYVVLRAYFVLKSGNADEIKGKMNELAARRREKQPLEYPSAGSTFKRPKGYFAAKLIDDAGLRGYSHGDAEVSVKHAGFVVNKGNATADDVLKVIEHVREVVLEKDGVELETEVKIIR